MGYGKWRVSVKFDEVADGCLAIVGSNPSAMEPEEGTSVIGLDVGAQILRN